MAYIPSAGLWGRRVIFVECPLVVRVERSGCVCPAFLFVEVVPSRSLLLVVFVFSVVGCCAFCALVLPLCSLLLVHSMPSGGRVG